MEGLSSCNFIFSKIDFDWEILFKMFALYYLNIYNSMRKFKEEMLLFTV